MSATQLGIVIRRQRQLKGWSQEELARRLEGAADQGAISRLEHGLIAEPTAKVLYHLAKAFGISSDELLAILVIGEKQDNVVHTAPQTMESDSELSKLKSQAAQLLERIEAYEQANIAVER